LGALANVVTVTVTPTATVATVTLTASVTSSITISKSATTVATTTVAVLGTVTDIDVSTSITISTVLPVLAKRDVTTTSQPAYASACTKPGSYASACSCLFGSALPTGTSTVTVTASVSNLFQSFWSSQLITLLRTGRRPISVDDIYRGRHGYVDRVSPVYVHELSIQHKFIDNDNGNHNDVHSRLYRDLGCSPYCPC
jgi:hypothetical protein